MQAHLVNFLIAASILTATPALAQERLTPEQPICAHCGSDILSGGGTVRQLPQMGGSFRPQPCSAGSDFHIRLPDVPGESSARPSAAGTPRVPTSISMRGQALMPELPICAHCAADVRR